MKHDDLRKLLDLWDQNPRSKSGGPTFREQMAKDAVTACGNNGINLEPDDVPALKQPNWQGPTTDLVLEVKIRP